MLTHYLKIALTVFRRRPFFTFVSLVGIVFTLTILMVAAAFLDHIFGAAAPETRQNRTLGLYRATLEGPDGELATALASYRLLDRTFQDLPGVEKTSISGVFWKATSYMSGQRVELFLKHTDAEFWEILEFDFVEGRPFTADEVDRGAHVAVINQATRERALGGGPAVGRMLEVDGEPFRVVGVVENVPMLRFVPFADVWVPQTTDRRYDDPTQLMGLFHGLILAEDRERFDEIRDEYLARIAAIDLEQYPGDWDRLTVVPETTFENVARLVFSQGRSTENHSARLLRWIMILATLFMILPALNLVNLNVSRIMERASEIGVRKAFGAPARTLVAQFVVENVVLTLAGGAVALLLSFLVLQGISSSGWIPYAEFRPNLRIFSYGLVTALFFGLLSGAYPAWRMSRMSPVAALRGGES